MRVVTGIVAVALFLGLTLGCAAGENGKDKAKAKVDFESHL